MKSNHCSFLHVSALTGLKNAMNLVLSLIRSVYVALVVS